MIRQNANGNENCSFFMKPNCNLLTPEWAKRLQRPAVYNTV